MYQFRLVEQYDPLFHCWQYGILQEEGEGNSWDTVACIPAVSPDRQFVIDLIGQCARGQLSPVHLFDVVLDALP